MRKRFQELLRQTGVRSELSSAYNSPSNGRCERSMGQVKSIIAKCKAAKECFWTALAEWKLAPRSDGPIPAQLFFRRQMRSGNIPEIHASLNIKAAIQEKEDSQRKCRVRGTVRHARPTMALHQHVLLQDRETKEWTIKGQVVSIRLNGRVIQTANGTYLRFIRFVKAAENAEVFRVVSAGRKLSVRPALSSGMLKGSSKAKKRVTWSNLPLKVVP